MTCFFTRCMIVLAALSLCAFVNAMDITAPQPEVELIAELRIAQAAGTAKFVPAVAFKQGQEIDYTVRITNPESHPIENITVVQPLPANTRYVADSATGAGAEIEFSIDGGMSFARPSSLRSTDDPDSLAAPAQYTHIRWQLRYPLAPHAVVLARFRAVFQ